MKHLFCSMMLFGYLTQVVFAEEPMTRKARTSSAVQHTRIDGFTLTLTPFLLSRVEGTTSSDVLGIRNKETSASFISFAGLGTAYVKIKVKRVEEFADRGNRPDIRYKGIMEGSPFSVAFCSQGLYVDPTITMLRDILGADAISDLRETPIQEVERQSDAYWRRKIPEALSQSAGDAMQAAMRLRVSEQELVRKMNLYHLSSRAH